MSMSMSMSDGYSDPEKEDKDKADSLEALKPASSDISEFEESLNILTAPYKLRDGFN
jgi:hypothetical protein